MRLKAIDSNNGIVTAVSSRLCPSSLQTLRRASFHTWFICLARRPVHATELESVADRRAARFDRSGWQFEHRGRLPEHTGQPKRTQLTSNGDHVPLAIEHDDVNREQHSQRVHALRRNDQQPISGRKGALAQQTDHACQSRIRKSDALADDRATRTVHCAKSLLVPTHVRYLWNKSTN